MEGAKKKTRKMKNRVPSVPRALSFLFSPGFAHLLVTSPYEKNNRGLCGGERLSNEIILNKLARAVIKLNYSKLYFKIKTSVSVYSSFNVEHCFESNGDHHLNYVTFICTQRLYICFRKPCAIHVVILFPGSLPRTGNFAANTCAEYKSTL